ncbi:MAG: exopolysaccharide biosynthesis polyprenyl glycosylphosphotransferase, partial [Ignavibacteriales bacterium]|nr:exopolysaccharide biosynthesis polyprenyl glycosylphosphotransferase [Ignavibacteriales bacterium]
MKNPKHKYLLLFLDWVIINYAFGVALKLQTQLNFGVIFTVPHFIAPLFFFFAGYSFVILFLFYINGLYHINIYLTVTKQLQAIIKSLVYSIVGIALLSFFTKSSIIVDSRLVIFYYFIVSLGSLIAVRILIFRTFFKFNLFSLIPLRRILIIGAEGRGIELATQIKELSRLGLHLVGFIDNKKPMGTSIVNGYKVIGNLAMLPRIYNDMSIDEIIFCLENTPENEYLELIERWSKSKARVLIAADQFEVIPKYVKEEYYGKVPVISVLNSPPYMGWNIIKRLIDVIFSLFGLIILSPLLLLVSIAIKLDSRGPILYKQIRLGKDGNPFTFFKFRSMYQGSDRDNDRAEKLKHFINEGMCENAASTKIVEESKVTRIGKFIRKTSIDELPQLLNVLKGEMSLVGPRPCLPYEWQNYAEWHKKRLSITPGCTGIWQVSGRSVVGFRDMAIL